MNGGSGIDVLTIDMSTGGRIGLLLGSMVALLVMTEVILFMFKQTTRGFARAFWNDGNDSNRQGIIIQCGKDDASGRM